MPRKKKQEVTCLIQTNRVVNLSFWQKKKLILNLSFFCKERKNQPKHKIFKKEKTSVQRRLKKQTKSKLIDQNYIYEKKKQFENCGQLILNVAEIL